MKTPKRYDWMNLPTKTRAEERVKALEKALRKIYERGDSAIAKNIAATALKGEK